MRNKSGGSKWDTDTVGRVAEHAAELYAENQQLTAPELLDMAMRSVIPDGPWMSPTYIGNPYVWSRLLRDAFRSRGIPVPGQYARNSGKKTA